MIAAVLPLSAADLHDAIQAGSLERVKEELARGAGVNKPDGMGATPLHDAVWTGNREIALYLLEHGADVKARHAEGGSTTVAYACIKNDLAMVELLVEHGADLGATDNAGRDAAAPGCGPRLRAADRLADRARRPNLTCATGQVRLRSTRRRGGALSRS